MTGRRLPDGFECTTPELRALGLAHTPLGSYWRDSQGVWCVCTPNGRIGSLAGHTVMLEDDGTITVSPSILVHAVLGREIPEDERPALRDAGYDIDVSGRWHGRPEFHGHLKNGVWTSC